MRRRGFFAERLHGLGAALAAALLSVILVSPAAATLLPEGFFDQLPQAGQGQVGIEADNLFYDIDTGLTVAEGEVLASYAGFQASADRMTFDQTTSALTLIGNVVVLAPGGAVYQANELALSGGFKTAIVDLLVLTTPDGAQITGSSADYAARSHITVTDASYAPCGDCIDAKGRTIGWRVRAAKMTYDYDSEMVTLENGSLELAGMPVLWLPGVAFPDPTNPRATGIRLPAIGYSQTLGLRASLPYFIALGPSTDLILTPELISSQGLLLGGTLTHRFDNGEIEFDASGIYQLDPGLFAGEVGDRRWRGAIQLTGEFTPVTHWTAGWSYTAFSDTAYLSDYDFTDGPVTNEVYVTHLSENAYLDARVQEFRLLGNPAVGRQGAEGTALPVITGDVVVPLGRDFGQIRLSGDLLGVQRLADHVESPNGVDHVLGHQENKYHGTVEALWSKRWVTAGGLVATPYLGLRLDAADYDGASAYDPVPASLLAATPIAALDVRWPLLAVNGAGGAHIIEPVAQLVYRGSDTSLTGITNDNAQSLVFDDTNLFSFDRFSGSDRQETGLRANVGVRYSGNFANGGWINAVAGQSYHLAGTNGFALPDNALTGTDSGLDNTASSIVVGAEAGLGMLTGGAKLQYDPNATRVARASAGLEIAFERFDVGVDYAFVAANTGLGVLADQHDIIARAGVPIDDYWRAEAGVGWDLAGNEWLLAEAGIRYDDGYLEAGLDLTFTGPTHNTPNDQRVELTLSLKGPDQAAIYQ